MKPTARQSGNLMIDLIVGILLLAIISISAGGVLSNLFQRSADAYERVQSTWLANSVMEYYSGKEFADIEAANISNDEKFTPDPRLVANVTVDWVTIDGDNIEASAEETSFKKIIVNANNNVSDNSVTLKTIISDGTGPGPGGPGPGVWTDLRAGNTFTHGNDAGKDIRYRSGMNMVQDANGMYFTGADPWASWVKFESLGWTRGTNKTLEWIMTNPTSSMMIGISSDAINEDYNLQYIQGEMYAYYQNPTKFFALYGNNGTPGTAGVHNGIAENINSNEVYKIRFENDGGRGETFTLFELPSAEQGDWDDESTLITTVIIGGTLAPDETNLFPAIIPRAGGAQRFIAVKVE